MAVKTGPAVGVAVVTYNSESVLADCLKSLDLGRGDVRLVDVVVADNDSSDGTVELARSFDGVRVVALGRNAGYAAGVNAAIASMPLDELDAVLVLNPDIRLRPGAVERLAQSLDHPDVGIVVPRLLEPDGHLQVSLRRAPSVRRALAEAVLGGARAGRTADLGELITDPSRYTVAGPAVWATGAALLVSRETILRVGSWDESLLLYGEEVEYALRAGDRGFVLWYDPDAVADHIGGEMATNPFLYALMALNRVRVFRMRHGRLHTAAFHLAVLAGEAARAATGRPTSRAAVRLLARPSRRPSE